MVRLLLLVFLCAQVNIGFGQNSAALPIGSQAPDFKLKGTNGKTYKLSSFKKSSVLVVVFTCNHCPTVQAYEDKIIQLSKEYKKSGVQVVAISPNAPEAVRLDECSYTDLGDSFEEMKQRAEDKDFPFPYLYDGETQAVAKAYGAVATPHVFIFDEKRTLQYSGRFDDTEKPTVQPTHQDAHDAVESLLTKKKEMPAATKAFGCSIKWKQKASSVKAEAEEWTKEAVTLEPINKAALDKLLKNDSDKLLMVNFWATWCGPCVNEFPDLTDIYHRYRVRDFNFVSISADQSNAKDKALKFLKKQNAAGPNYIIEGMTPFNLIEYVGGNWQGSIPYTLLIEPGGKVIYAFEGQIDPLVVKKKIVEHPIMGRYF